MTAVDETAAAPEREFGRARRRKEDARLITGRTRWTDNIQLPGMLHLAMVRSPLAHARITSIDTSAAKQSSGVVGVWSGPELAGSEAGLPCAWPITEGMASPTHPAIAQDAVTFAGEVVAVVAARSAAEARDAADLVDVQYEELPVVLDMEAALAEGAPLAHPELGTNENATWEFDSAAAGTGEDVEALIQAARDDPDSVVIQRRFPEQRAIPALMETPSLLVDPPPQHSPGRASTHVPPFVRGLTALLT